MGVCVHIGGMARWGVHGCGVCVGVQIRCVYPAVYVQMCEYKCVCGYMCSGMPADGCECTCMYARV